MAARKDRQKRTAFYKDGTRGRRKRESMCSKSIKPSLILLAINSSSPFGWCRDCGCASADQFQSRTQHSRQRRRRKPRPSHEYAAVLFSALLLKCTKATIHKTHLLPHIRSTRTHSTTRPLYRSPYQRQKLPVLKSSGAGSKILSGGKQSSPSGANISGSMAGTTSLHVRIAPSFPGPG